MVEEAAVAAVAAEVVVVAPVGEQASVVGGGLEGGMGSGRGRSALGRAKSLGLGFGLGLGLPISYIVTNDIVHKSCYFNLLYKPVVDFANVKSGLSKGLGL